MTNDISVSVDSVHIGVEMTFINMSVGGDYVKSALVLYSHDNGDWYDVVYYAANGSKLGVVHVRRNTVASVTRRVAAHAAKFDEPMT